MTTLIATLAGSVDGYVTGLSTGEGWKLTDRQWLELTETVVEQAGEAPVYAGILRSTTAEVRVLAKRAQELGVQAVVVTQPFQRSLKMSAVSDHFADIQQECGLPLIVYHEATFAKALMTSDVLTAVIERCEVAAVKDSSGVSGKDAPWDRVPPVRRLQGMELLLCGDAADGAIVGLSNVEPELVRRAVDAPAACLDAVAAAVQRYEQFSPRWYERLKAELCRRGTISSLSAVDAAASPTLHSINL